MFSSEYAAKIKKMPLSSINKPYAEHADHRPSGKHN
jgi:hypothetical protein